MCDQVGRPLVDRGAGGRSPGYLLKPRWRHQLVRPRRQEAADRDKELNLLPVTRYYLFAEPV
jgi:hypothetical protein